MCQEVLKEEADVVRAWKPRNLYPSPSPRAIGSHGRVLSRSVARSDCVLDSTDGDW